MLRGGPRWAGGGGHGQRSTVAASLGLELGGVFGGTRRCHRCDQLEHGVDGGEELRLGLIEGFRAWQCRAARSELETKGKVCGNGERLKVEMVSPGPGFMANEGGGGSSGSGAGAVRGRWHGRPRTFSATRRGSWCMRWRALVRLGADKSDKRARRYGEMQTAARRGEKRIGKKAGLWGCAFGLGRLKGKKGKRKREKLSEFGKKSEFDENSNLTQVLKSLGALQLSSLIRHSI